MKKTGIFISMLFFALFTFSCKSGGDKQTASSSSKVHLDEIIKAADAISPDITNVKDVFKILDMVHAGYYPVLCNDPYNAPKYLNNKQNAAANLGIYVTDIVYNMYGEGTEDMYLAFSASQELARYIGLESKFAVTLLTELEGNRLSRDSLIIAFNGLMEESQKYTSAKEMAYVHTAFLSGLYIEKLYITSSLLNQALKKEAPSDQEITDYKQLLAVYRNQLKSLDQLSTSIKEYKDQLSEVLPYDAITGLKEKHAAFEGSVNELLGAEGISTNDALTKLNDAILALRNQIVTTVG